MGLRSILAPNASPMTMDGTRTYLLGAGEVAILDPGSADPAHLGALASAVAGATRVTILVTHDHPDHSTGALELGQLLGTEVCGVAGGRSLSDGDRIPTDAGDLVCVATPGHTPDHMSFHWPAGDAVFCGDLMMGGMDTSLVAAPEGDIAAYLASLERLRALRPTVIYPAHGPPFTDPGPAIDRYVEHRWERERQVLEAVAAGAATAAAITDRVYGHALHPGLQQVAEAAVQAYLEHLGSTGRLPEGGR